MAPKKKNDQDSLTEVPETGLQLVLKGTDVAEVWQIESQSEQGLRLEALLAIDVEQKDLLTDFHTGALANAKAVQLRPYQAAVFHAIMSLMLQRAKAIPVVTEAECFTEFQQLMMQHMEKGSQEGPRADIFSEKEVKSLTDTATETFFKQFRLYQKKDLDSMTEVIETGLHLPLRGKDVAEVWHMDSHYGEQGMRLQALLGLESEHPLREQRDIVTDFHIYALAHAKAVQLRPYQAAVFHAIMSAMLQKAKTVPVTTEAADCFTAFQKLMLQHMEQGTQEESRADIFSEKEVRLLTDFATETFFKHFRLYQYCMKHDQEVQTHRFCMPFDVPLAPLDLMDAKPRPPPEKEVAMVTMRNPFSMMANVNVAGDGHKTVDTTQTLPADEATAPADGAEGEEGAEE